MKYQNILMSLPTSLIHCILSDWLDVIATIRLDFALGGDKVLHTQLLDVITSDHYYAKKVNRGIGLRGCGKLRSEHPYTHMLSWLIWRQVKVKCIELNPGCWYVVLEKYLQMFGKHIRQICPHEDGHQRYRDREAPTQSALIAKYCQNLRTYFVRCIDVFDGDIGSVLGVLTNNPLLEVLHIEGVLINENDPTKSPTLALHHLKQLKWESRYGFDESLVALAKAAPHLQQLVLISNPTKCTELDGTHMLEVAYSCQHLCTLSCQGLYIGRNDSSLKQFLSICSNIVNLDLHGHHKLCDAVLIDALRELPKLNALNLRGCCRLTDKALKYITRHYSSTLKVLYLDHSIYPGYINEGGIEEMNEVVRKEMKRGKGGYTAARIAKLRKRCTQLHTFHYIIEAGTVSKTQHVAAYQMATIVQVCAKSEVLVPTILKHCKQVQILAMTYPQYGSHEKVSLTPDELMT